MVQELHGCLIIINIQTKKDKYKLFFATNLHVLARFSNSLEESVSKAA
nr:hypothetical protein [Mycoplasmopsis bovis]